MALVDPIGDALTVIRNGSRAKKERVDLKASSIVTEILKVLRQERFIHDYRLIEDKKQGLLRVYLRKDGQARRPIIQVVRISKPGRRVYADKASVPTVLNGLGLCILSTSQGVMTGSGAKHRGIGGEIICKVW